MYVRMYVCVCVSRKAGPLAGMLMIVAMMHDVMYLIYAYVCMCMPKYEGGPCAGMLIVDWYMYVYVPVC